MASIAEAARRHDSKSREIDLCCELIVNERLRDNSFFPHIPERSFFGISGHKQDRERRLPSCQPGALTARPQD
jgi:hypothetical protein